MNDATGLMAEKNLSKNSVQDLTVNERILSPRLHWNGSERVRIRDESVSIFSSVYTGSDPNQSPFTLGTELEQFHLNCLS